MSMQAQASHGHESEETRRITQAIGRIFRPVIRLFVGKISCGFLIQRIKQIYIEEARAWIAAQDPGARVTKSKLAMLTGLDTRTITHIEEQACSASDVTPDQLCAESSVMSLWVAGEEFQDEAGDPATLPIMGRAGSFQSLVRRAVGRNVTYQTLLDRLLESGNVEWEGENHLRLVDPFYQPMRRSEQTFISAGSLAIGRLTSTIVHNMNADEGGERMLQQDRWAVAVPRDRERALEREIRALLDRQIGEAEQLLIEYEVDPSEPDTTSVGIGWFVFK